MGTYFYGASEGGEDEEEEEEDDDDDDDEGSIHSSSSGTLTGSVAEVNKQEDGPVDLSSWDSSLKASALGMLFYRIFHSSF